MRRLAAYQHRWYAEWYLNRLDTVHALGSTELLRETARHLAVRMSFEDVIRVAQAEVRAKDGEPMEITEHFKPGIEEIAAILPPAWAKRLLAWGERTGRLGKTYFSMHLRSTTVLGFLRLRLVAGLRRSGRTPTVSPRSRPRSTAGWSRSAPQGAPMSTWRARSPSAPA